MLNAIEATAGAMALPLMLLAVVLSWGGAKKRSVAKLEGAHRLFMLVVLLDLIRLGFDVTRPVTGAEYWTGVLVQVAVTSTAIYLMISTGRDADRAERQAMSGLTGNA